MSDEELEKIVNELAAEWGVGGFDCSTLYGEFAMEVARRAIARYDYESPGPR